MSLARAASCAAVFEFSHGFRHERTQLFDTCAVRRMGGCEFGWLIAAGFAHAFPKFNTLPRIVASTRHIKQSHVVGLGLVITTERENQSVLSAGTQGSHYRVALLWIKIPDRKLRTGHKRLREAGPQQSL